MACKIITALALVAALAACKTTDVTERPPNPGSHTVPWVHNALLPGRTVLLFDKISYRADWKNWFVTRAVYQTEDHRTLSCEGEKRRYSAVRFDGSYFTFLGDGGRAAAGYGSGLRLPIFYDGHTGRFHIEWWNERVGAWWIDADGWIQEGWPRLMADACPELTEEILADGGWINEKQTHPTIYKMLDQDPDAPLRLPHMSPDHYTGIAARTASDTPWHWCFESPSKPVLPANCFPEGEEAEPTAVLSDDPEHAAQLHLAALLKENNGTIVTDALGREYVLALHAEGDELWAVDEAGAILDIGHLAWNASAHRVELDWETFPETRDYLHRPGDAPPVFATGKRHPIFAMTDWLTDEEDVVLPFMGRDALFRFAGDGQLIVRGTERDFPGTWIVSRGRLVLAIEGIEERTAYPWQALAAYLEAEAGYEASAG